MSRNLLAAETSPYLRQHKDNPVHWRPWNPAALAEARAEKKPILLSVGYAACHWCHVMAHESFEAPAIAELMNRHFIPIKVDREERPDIDLIYQSALALMGEHGGWPLTMFLTPEGEPFWGGTYFPPEPRYGRPGFAQVLMFIHDAWTTQADFVRNNAQALRQALGKLDNPPVGGALTIAGLDEAARDCLRGMDMDRGGSLGAPKFPQVSTFDFLWRFHRRAGHPAAGAFVRATLDNICQGGIYDHLGGGFARYATDEIWLVPHFEKMLYDNAQMLGLLARVHADGGEPLYAARAAETVAWLLREMRLPGGAFAASLDADTEGREGATYVWTEAEIDAVLGPDAALFKTVYGVSHAGNWDDVNILNRLGDLRLGSDEQETCLANCREKLRAVRDARPQPGRDDKVLADWNGMTIVALAEAAMIFDRPDWLDAARGAFVFTTRTMTRDGRLHHAWCADRLGAMGTLDDLAQMARAALALHEATGEASFLAQARAFAADADRRHWDAADGGYFLAADDVPDLLARGKPFFDSPTPTGNAAMAEVLARLFHLTGEAPFLDRAEALVARFAAQDMGRRLASPALLNAFELLADPLSVALIGPTAPMIRAAYRAGGGNRVLLRLDPAAVAPPGHPAAGKAMVDGRPTAYVCRNFTCGLPLTSAQALSAALHSR